MNINNEFCNIQIDLEDRIPYGLNVYTYNFLIKSISYDEEIGEKLKDLYQIPPGLFVKLLTRECIQDTLDDILKIGDLDPSILIKTY